MLEILYLAEEEHNDNRNGYIWYINASVFNMDNERRPIDEKWV